MNCGGSQIYSGHPVILRAEVGRVLGGGSQSGVEGGGSRKWLEGYTNIAHIDQFCARFFCFSKKKSPVDFGGEGGGENGFRAIQI